MKYKDRMYLTEKIFYEIIKNVIYIKYTDEVVDYCNYIKELIEYKSKISASLTDLDNYIIYDKKDKHKIYDLVSEVNERFLKYVEHLYNKLDFISEIKFFSSSSMSEIHILSLKNGYLHSVNGPAQIIGNNINFYYIDGVNYKYEDWKSHPKIRHNKLDKLIRNIKP